MRANKFLRFLSILLITVTTALGIYSQNARAGLFNSSLDRPLPAFSLPTLDNASKQLSNKTLTGHVSLLNIWASWCHYCQNEHAILMKIKSAHVPIYGILYHDDSGAARAYLKENGNPYVMVGVDWQGRAVSQFGAEGTPQTFIIDKHGKLREHYTGSLDEGRWKDIQEKIKMYESEK